MEMSTYRGPSAEDHHHASPGPDDRKSTTLTTNISVTEDLIATRKCCTLCNLLVRSILSSTMFRHMNHINFSSS